MVLYHLIINSGKGKLETDVLVQCAVLPRDFSIKFIAWIFQAETLRLGQSWRVGNPVSHPVVCCPNVHMPFNSFNDRLYLMKYFFNMWLSDCNQFQSFSAICIRLQSETDE